MKLLIVIPEGMFTNTSSSIFAYRFIKELSKTTIVDIIGFKLPDDYLLKYEVDDIKIRRFIHLKSILILKNCPKKFSNINSKKPTNTRVLAKKLAKKLSPDYLALGLLDIANINEIDLDKNYDYIISMSDPKSAHYLAIFLRYRFKSLSSIKFIQIWGDPWYHDITRETSVIDKMIESYVIMKADLIFYRSQPTLDLQALTYPKYAYKMKLIHRGFSGPMISNYLATLSTRKLKFAYLGAFNPNVRNIETFCNVATKLGHFITIAGSSTPESIIRIKNFPNLTFLGRLPPNKLDKIYDEADCIIIAMNKAGTQIPGKIYDLIPIQKPIILLLDGKLTHEDVPLQERFYIVENNQDSIESFFNDNKDIKVLLNSGFNKLHISVIVKRFIEQINIMKDN